MTTYAPSSYEFSPFLLKPRERMLLKHGLPVSLQPMALDVLCVLVQNAGRPVTKDELMQTLWLQHDRNVEEGNIPVHVCHIRDALDPSNRNLYITTLPGRGYQFVAEVREVSDSWAKADSRAIGDLSVCVASPNDAGGIVPAPEEIILVLINTYAENGYNSRRLEQCRRLLSLPEAEQERKLAEMMGLTQSRETVHRSMAD